MSSRYPHAFNPIEIRGHLFKNRIELAPPGCLGGGDERGFATSRFVNLFRQFARAGIAIVAVGNCSIDKTESSDEGGQLELKDPAAVMPLVKFARMCEGFGAYGCLELTHNRKDTPFEEIGQAPYSCSSFITVTEKLRSKRLGRDPIPLSRTCRE